MTPVSYEPNTAESLEWEALLAHLIARLSTEYGHREAMALEPMADAEAARRSLRRIGEMMALEKEYGAPDFAGVKAIDDLLERAGKAGLLTGEELLRLLGTQQAAREIARKLRLPEGAHLLHRRAGRIDELAGWCEGLSRALTPAGELDERTFPHLGEMRREVAKRRDRIHRVLDSLLHSRALLPMLQEPIYSVRGSRYVVPLKTDFRGQLKGIVHDVSASGATLFVEPEPVMEETNALVYEERRLANEVEAILRDLSAKAGEVAPALRKNTGWIGRIDLLAAQARLAADYGGSLPEVGDHERIELRAAAHPLMVLDGAEVVRNDLSLGGETRCLVVSGANTGGKTVLLKTVGLCLFLVAHGMPVPAAAGSRVDLFPFIGAEVGDRQNLSHSLSTFSAQIETLAWMISRAGPDSVILVDEILTGTEPRQGAALAAAALEILVDRGALCLVTTHYADLKSLAGARSGFTNASVAFDADRLRPTYRLQVGLPGASYAFSIARRHGLDEALVRAAEERLDRGPAVPDALLAQLHREEAAYRERMRELERREAEAGRARDALDRRDAALAEREGEMRRRERGGMGKALREARAEIATVIRDLQRGGTAADAAQAREKLAAIEAEVGRSLADPPTTPERPLDWSAVKPGDAVYLPALGRVATLEDTGAKGKTARARVGALVFEAPRDEMAAVPPGAQPRAPGRSGHRAAPGNGGGRRPTGVGGSAPATEKSAAPGPLVVSGEENTLDLRGLRLGEALERADAFFDLCVVKHVSPVLLIHGHGTGRLKVGLRARLEESPYVAAFRAGEGREGGDGVTVVALNL